VPLCIQLKSGLCKSHGRADFNQLAAGIEGRLMPKEPLDAFGQHSMLSAVLELTGAFVQNTI
jgi:hypothetical protein